MRAPETLRRNEPAATGLSILVGGLALVAAALVYMTVASIPLADLLRPWYLSRAAGFVSYFLMWGSIVLGLLQSMGALKQVSKAAANVDVHDYISMASIYTGLFHGVILMFDKPDYAYRWQEVLIPFATARHPVLTAFGILALYLSVLAALTTYARGKMNAKWWRAIHLSTVAGFAMALAHGLLMGTDSSSPVVFWIYLLTGASALLLVLLRISLAMEKH